LSETEKGKCIKGLGLKNRILSTTASEPSEEGIETTEERKLREGAR
jgi:hypothetical protein